MNIICNVCTLMVYKLHHTARLPCDRGATSVRPCPTEARPKCDRVRLINRHGKTQPTNIESLNIIAQLIALWVMYDRVPFNRQRTSHK